MINVSRVSKIILVLVIIAALSGCATPTKTNPDPYARYNRAVFNFNMGFNRIVLTPITTLYSDVTPGIFRTGVSHFFNNIRTVPSIANDLLQGNWRYFFKDVTRLFLNTTLGVFGLVDVASDSGLPAHQQDFGMTLYRWGIMRNSSYLVLPLIGASTLRSTVGMVPDYFLDPLNYYYPVYIRHSLKALDMLQRATDLLPRLRFITREALDPYVAVRNAYLQNQNLVAEQIMTDGESEKETAEPIQPLSLSNKAHTGASSDISPLLAEQIQSEQEQTQAQTEPAQDQKGQVQEQTQAQTEPAQDQKGQVQEQTQDQTAQAQDQTEQVQNQKEQKEQTHAAHVVNGQPGSLVASV